MPASSGGSGSSSQKVAAVLKVPAWARTTVVTPCPSKQSSSSQSKTPPPIGSGNGLFVAPPCSG
jgi:hypothetical protein